MLAVVSGLLAAACSDASDAEPGRATAETSEAPDDGAGAAEPSASGSAAPGDTTSPGTPGTHGPGVPLEAPDGDAFYLAPVPIPGDAPGDLIWVLPIDGPPAGTVGWRVLYRSESVSGEPIAVSGVVFAPAAPAGDDRPVLSWAHGTTGMADDCAPSLAYAAGEGFELILAQAVAALGYTFVATDYEGLGTPGVHPYLVGQSEARGVLDIVRAAEQLDGAGVGDGSPVAIFGHSQGGHAALMAAEIAATYAPELTVVGTVAGAPPADVALIESGAAAAGEYLTGGFSLMIDAGYLAAYPDLPVDAVVTEQGRDALVAVTDTCVNEALDLALGAGPAIQLDGTRDPEWAATYAANSPGDVAPSAPVLIVHGSGDDVVPPVLSELVAADYCALGVTVQRTVYDGADHVSVVTQALAEVQGWVADRLAGRAAPSNC